MSSTCLSPGIFGSCMTRLTTGQAVGLMVDLETGFLSVLAVLIFLSLVARNVTRHYKHPPPGGWSLLRTHIDAYFLSLLGFEFIHGLAAMMSAKWVHEGQTYCGSYCTVQGLLRNTGSTGSALVTLAIAVHTFAVIFFQWIPPRSLIMPFLVLFGISSFLIGHIAYQLSVTREPDEPFYGPTPYWCWITSRHRAARIYGQYLWMWLTAFLSILLYVPLYFCVKGNLSYRPHLRWKVYISRSPKKQEDGAPPQTHAAKAATTDAMCMLYYPVVYIILVLPLSIVRFMSESWEMQGRRFPFAPTVAGSALFGFSAVVNVILFMMTRPNLLLFRSGTHAPLPRYKLNGARSPGAETSEWQREAAGYPNSPPSTGQSMEPLVGPRPAQNPWHDFEMTVT